LFSKLAKLFKSLRIVAYKCTDCRNSIIIVTSALIVGNSTIIVTQQHLWIYFSKKSYRIVV